MNYLEKIPESVSINQSHPDSFNNINDMSSDMPHLNFYANSQSNSNSQCNQISSTSVVVLKDAENNLTEDLMRGAQDTRILETIKVMVREPNHAKQNHNNKRLVKPNLRHPSKVSGYQESGITLMEYEMSNGEWSKKWGICEELDKIPQSVSINESSTSNEKNIRMSTLFSCQQSQIVDQHATKPVYKKIFFPKIENKSPSLSSKISLTYKNDDMTEEFEKCRNLLALEIQKNKELENRLSRFSIENEELRAVIEKLTGQAAKTSVQSSKKRLTSDTKSNRVFSEISQNKLQTHSKFILGASPQKKFIQRIHHTEYGPPVSRNQKEKKTSKKRTKNSSKNKAMEALQKKICRLEFALNEIVESNRITMSYFSHNKDYEIAKGSIKMDRDKYLRLTDVEKIGIKKNLSKNNMRVKTETYERFAR